MTIEHTYPMGYLVPGIGATRNTASLPVTFIVQYCKSSSLIQNLQVHWDNATLYPLLGIPLVNCPLPEQELIVCRATRPSANDFAARIEMLLAANNATATSKVKSEFLPISKRTTINSLFCHNEQDLGELSSEISQMEITPRKSERPIIGIGPSKQLQSNLFQPEQQHHAQAQQLESIESQCTPLKHTKQQKTTQTRIFGVEGEEESTLFYSSANSSSVSLTAGRIFDASTDADSRPMPLVKPLAATNSNNESGIFNVEAKASQFIPSYGPTARTASNPFEGDASPFKPALAAHKVLQRAEKCPQIKKQLSNYSNSSQISFGNEDCDE